MTSNHISKGHFKVLGYQVSYNYALARVLHHMQNTKTEVNILQIFWLRLSKKIETAAQENNKHLDVTYLSLIYFKATWVIETTQVNTGGVIKNFSNFTGKYLCWSLHTCNFISETPTHVFSCKIYEIIQKIYFEVHLQTTALKIYLQFHSYLLR